MIRAIAVRMRGSLFGLTPEVPGAVPVFIEVLARGHRRHAFGPIRYKRRNVVERCFNRLKHFKGIATRYDKLAAHYRSAVTIACLPLWLR